MHSAYCDPDVQYNLQCIILSSHLWRNPKVRKYRLSMMFGGGADRLPGHLSRVCPASRPVSAGIGSGSPCSPQRRGAGDNGWMDVSSLLTRSNCPRCCTPDVQHVKRLFNHLNSGHRSFPFLLTLMQTSAINVLITKQNVRARAHLPADLGSQDEPKTSISRLVDWALGNQYCSVGIRLQHLHKQLNKLFIGQPAMGYWN